MRWNAIVDTGGTPPGLRGMARDPERLEGEIKAIARRHGCEADVWWDRYNWFAYITLTTSGERPDPRRALEELEAEEVRPQLNSGEKARHPWFQSPGQPQARQAPYDDEEGLPPQTK